MRKLLQRGPKAFVPQAETRAYEALDFCGPSRGQNPPHKYSSLRNMGPCNAEFSSERVTLDVSNSVVTVS